MRILLECRNPKIKDSNKEDYEVFCKHTFTHEIPAELDLREDARRFDIRVKCPKCQRDIIVMFQASAIIDYSKGGNEQ